VIKHQMIAERKTSHRDADKMVAGRIACVTFPEGTICRASNKQTHL
jgi:hypothetical protein